MQIAVSGTYSKGQIILDEIPPIQTDTSEVMVVFLGDHGKEAVNQMVEMPKIAPTKSSRRSGLLRGKTLSPEFFEPLDKDELSLW